MSLVIYNTMNKKKEPFNPIKQGEVKLYLCGPTVYDFLHIGNFRGAIFFNLVRNWLEHLGNKVTFVYNYTDVDDKIIKRAHDEGVQSKEISERFIKEFEKDISDLKLVPHDYNPRVTEYIPQIIGLIEKIIENDKAYVVDGEVFYSIDSFENYGKLSGKKLDELEAGSRVEVDQRKKNPFDFVLWKPSKEGEPAWESPWGVGRPGWHIECSAMIHGILGESIDIHGGGIDLIFPHHENEIAQGEAATGKQYCRHWMHNNFLNMNDEKMSKSLGNVVKGRDFIRKYDGEILKYIMLQAHYRSMFNINNEKIHQTMMALSRIYKTKLKAQQILKNEIYGHEEEPSFMNSLEQASQKIETALNDDFNTGETLAAIFEVVRAFNSINPDKKNIKTKARFIAENFILWLEKYGQMMALFGEQAETYLASLRDLMLNEKGLQRTQVEELVTSRREARERKDFEGADEIRDKLNQMGIDLLDGVEGFEWEVKFGA